MKHEKSPKRLVVDIYDDLHTKIKMHAAKRNMSLRKYVSRILLRALWAEERYEQSSEENNSQ